MKNVFSGLDRLLIGVGIGLLLAGAYLAYPYVHSRLMRPIPAAPVPPPSPAATEVPGSIQEVPLPARLDGGLLPREETPRADEVGEKGSGTDATGVRPGVGVTDDSDGPRTAGSTSQPPEAVAASGPVVDEASAALPKAGGPAGTDSRRLIAPPERIVIPTLGLDAPVIPVSRYETQIGGKAQLVWGVPDVPAAGWHDNSARLGKVGNTVLNGHNTNNGEIFRDLYRLRPGDEIVLYAPEISARYQVSSTLILPEAGQTLEVRLENARYVRATDDRRVTLVTCHPYGSLRNRLIVIAKSVEPVDAWKLLE